MSITFQLSVPGLHPCLNLANSNACAMLVVAGLPSAEFGEVVQAEVGGVVARLLRAVNVAAARSRAVSQCESAPCGRWLEASRDDAYVERRTQELLALFRAAQTHRCAVTWG